MASKKDGRTPPPNSSYVMSLYDMKKLDGDEGVRRTRMAEMRELVAMAQEVEIPEQYRAITKEVRTPFTRDTWLRVTAALTEKPPVAHVEARDETQEMKRSANVAERWTQAAIEAMNARLGEDVVYESVKALVRDEESVIKVVHKPDAWANFPRRLPGEEPVDFTKRTTAYKQSASLPFAWRVVDRLSMLFGNGEFGDDWAIEYGEYATPYLGNRYEMEAVQGRLRNPAYLLSDKPKPEGELNTASGRSIKVEYWDADWWHVVIDGDDAPGFPRHNPYFRMPYFRAKASEPVLLALKWLVPTLDNLLTMKMNWAYLGAYPNPVLRPMPGVELPPLGADENPASFEWTPGKLIQAPYGHEFGFVSPPPVGQDLNDLVTIIRGLIDVAGVPSVFRGIGGADQAGYAINQLIAAANLTYKILSKVAQAQLQEAASFLWSLVMHRIRQTVYVLEMPEISPETGKPKKNGKAHWLGLTPKASDAGPLVAPIEHLAKLFYNFRPVLPTDEQARAMIAMQLRNAPSPLTSTAHALEKYLQEEDPERIMDEMKVEKYLEEPPIKDAILTAALRKAKMLPEQQKNPAADLVDAAGRPLLPATPGTFPPGQMSQGLPAVPGLTQPLTPPMPAAPAIGTGGRVAGSYPGRPGGVPRERQA